MAGGVLCGWICIIGIVFSLIYGILSGGFVEHFFGMTKPDSATYAVLLLFACMPVLIGSIFSGVIWLLKRLNKPDDDIFMAYLAANAFLIGAGLIFAIIIYYWICPVSQTEMLSACWKTLLCATILNLSALIVPNAFLKKFSSQGQIVLSGLGLIIGAIPFLVFVF